MVGESPCFFGTNFEFLLKSLFLIALAFQVNWVSASDAQLLASLSQEERDYLVSKQIIRMPTYSGVRLTMLSGSASNRPYSAN